MMYKDYLEKNHSFDKKTMLGIFLYDYSNKWCIWFFI